MTLGIVEIVAIMLITIGPLKAAVVYSTLTAGAATALRRAIAVKTIIVASIVIVVFIGSASSSSVSSISRWPR